MKQMIDIVALGELLIDFTEAGVGADGMKLFEQNPGGAPANLLTVASHMGYRTEFIGKVGKDMHGAFLKKTLEKEKIGVLTIQRPKILQLPDITGMMARSRQKPPATIPE